MHEGYIWANERITKHFAEMEVERHKWLLDVTKHYKDLRAVAAKIEEADCFMDAVYRKLGIDPYILKENNITNFILKHMSPEDSAILRRYVKQSRIFWQIKESSMKIIIEGITRKNLCLNQLLRDVNKVNFKPQKVVIDFGNCELILEQCGVVTANFSSILIFLRGWFAAKRIKVTLSGNAWQICSLVI